MVKKLLGSQKCIFNKAGIRYKPYIKQKYMKNCFVKATSINDSKIACNYYNGMAHMSYTYPIKKNTCIQLERFEFQSEPKLTLKDPKGYEYQSAQLEYFCKYQNQGIMGDSLLRIYGGEKHPMEYNICLDKM